MVAGIVLFAFGLETTLHDVNDPLRIVPALGLCAGIALYLLAHVALRLRIGAGFGRGRSVATVLLLGLVPVARVVPALTALGLVAAVCAALIGYEAIRYREGRAWIRSRRGAFTMEEVARAPGRSRGRDGVPRADSMASVVVWLVFVVALPIGVWTDTRWLAQVGFLGVIALPVAGVIVQVASSKSRHSGDPGR